MLLREELALEAKEGRHPVWVPVVEPPGQADELFKVAFGGNRCYRNGGGWR